MDFKKVTEKLKKIFSEPQELADEKDAFLKAQEVATETGVPQKVVVDGENLIVKDEGKAGIEVFRAV